jgi:microcystin-dependent protein
MDYLLGDIILLATNYAPEYTLDCNGQSLNINDYNALYALLGVKFGGDGFNTFKLPDLRGTEPHPNTRYCIIVNGIFPQQQ